MAHIVQCDQCRKETDRSDLPDGTPSGWFKLIRQERYGSGWSREELYHFCSVACVAARAEAKMKADAEASVKADIAYKVMHG